MSTNDVPGAVAGNFDVLAMGCWAEADKGQSLVLVESTEGGRVIYSMFDLNRILEYRDAMPEATFNKAFSWDPNNPGATAGAKWTWHDKTLFPWEKILNSGIKDGFRHPSADHLQSAAEKVADHLSLQARELDGSRYADRVDRVVGKGFFAVKDKLSRALGELRR